MSTNKPATSKQIQTWIREVEFGSPAVEIRTCDVCGDIRNTRHVSGIYPYVTSCSPCWIRAHEAMTVIGCWGTDAMITWKTMFHSYYPNLDNYEKNKTGDAATQTKE